MVVENVQTTKSAVPTDGGLIRLFKYVPGAKYEMIESWKLSVGGSCCAASPNLTRHILRKGSTLGAAAGQLCSAPRSLPQSDVRRGTENPTCEGESDMLMACAHTQLTQAGAKRKRQPAAAAVCLGEKTLRIARAACLLFAYMYMCACRCPLLLLLLLCRRRRQTHVTYPRECSSSCEC